MSNYQNADYYFYLCTVILMYRLMKCDFQPLRLRDLPRGVYFSFNPTVFNLSDVWIFKGYDYSLHRFKIVNRACSRIIRLYDTGFSKVFML